LCPLSSKSGKLARETEEEKEGGGGSLKEDEACSPQGRLRRRKHE